MNDTSPEPLFTLNFLAACTSNLFLFTAMYIILPILPLYLSDELHVGSFQTGIILAAFTTAALVIRPFSGFIVEHFPGKKLFLLLYASFAICFFAYPFLSSILLVGFVRFAHGLCFGVATTASTTLAISIIPRPRLGSGIGFYGMTAALSMAIGPMLSMYTLQEYGFQTVFILAAVIIVAFVVTLIAQKIKSFWALR